MRSVRPTRRHSHGSAPETPPRSTMIHRVPPHFGQTGSVGIWLYYPAPGASLLLLHGQRHCVSAGGGVITGGFGHDVIGTCAKRAGDAGAGSAARIVIFVDSTAPGVQ